jgi:hypothetical protein
MASTYSKRHYEGMAEYINTRRKKVAFLLGDVATAGALVILDDMEKYWSIIYAADNPRFDKRRFHIACNVGIGD